MSKPLVSICCVTYNHAPFIQKCLDGFLMQKLDLEALPCREEYEVGFEILIHDDCSTDGTTEIVKEFAEKYPDKIFPLYEEENQFCKPGRESMDFYNYRRAKGKYIAICEGDDYWTDPLKLQKQVEFMEAHEEYSVCWTRCKHYIISNGAWQDDNCGALLGCAESEDGIEIDLSSFFANWYTQPLTMLFRISAFSYDWQKMYPHYRDTYEIYHLLKAGKGRLMNFVSGVYNVHDHGMSAGLNKLQSCGFELESANDLYRYNKDKVTKLYWENVVLWSLSTYKSSGLNTEYTQLVLKELKLDLLSTLKLLIILSKRRTKSALNHKYQKLKKKLNKTLYSSIPVFCFHQVSELYDPLRAWECDWIQTDDFKKKIVILQRKGYQFISLTDALHHLKHDWLRRKQFAVLTADDGYATLKNVLPWLKEQEIPITLFLNTKYIDGQSWSAINEEQAKRVDANVDMQMVVNGLYLTKKELFQFTSPLIEIGMHGHEHVDALNLSKVDFEKNMQVCQNTLKDHPRYVPYYAYTWGHHSDVFDGVLEQKELIPVLMNGAKNYKFEGFINREEL